VTRPVWEEEPRTLPHGLAETMKWVLSYVFFLISDYGESAFSNNKIKHNRKQTGFFYSFSYPIVQKRVEKGHIYQSHPFGNPSKI
jgi:hypothetical protein